MLDIRTLPLGAPEDRYATTPTIREAERLLFPLLCGRGMAAAVPAGRAGTWEEGTGRMART